MRIVAMAVAVVMTVSTGCLHTELQRNTVRQASTITDLRYQQVLNNLAMIAHNHSLLPHYAVITGGTAQVDDSVGANATLAWGWASNEFPGGMNEQGLGIMGQKNRLGNWSLDPLHDPERLSVMRCVYQAVLGVLPPDCHECTDKLYHFRVDDDLGKIEPGWFYVGGKKSVPKHACYVGHYCGTYVWVMPEGIEGLTRLSLIILDIATVDLASLSPTKTIVRKYNSDCKLVEVTAEMEIDASEPDCIKGEQVKMRPRAPKRREVAPVIPRGLFTLPRR